MKPERIKGRSDYMEIWVNGWNYQIDDDVVAQLPRDRAAMEEGLPYVEASIKRIGAEVAGLERLYKRLLKKHGSGYLVGDVLAEAQDGFDNCRITAGHAQSFLTEQEEAARRYTRRGLGVLRLVG